MAYNSIYRLLFFLVLFVSEPVFSQTQLSTAQKDILAKEILDRINELREEEGVPPLKASLTLRTAAEGHNQYITKKGKLSHFQTRATTKDPSSRVKQVEGGDEYQIVGENILYTRPVSSSMKKNELIDLAEEIFQQWKNSPGHRANMVFIDYEFEGIAFDINPKTKQLFATQVFGRKGTQIDNQLSSDDFGLVQADSDCDKEYREFFNLVLNMGNSLKLDDNYELTLYFSDIERFKKVFSGPKDGLSIDILTRDQIPCDGPSVLDFSPIHDGILLPPIYRQELLAGNRAQGNYRIITPVGVLPESLRDKEISASILLIKDGKKCKYLVPSIVPSKSLDPFDFKPVCIDPKNPPLSAKGIVHTETVYFDFQTNSTQTLALPELEKFPAPIYTVTIESYSSVEGDSDKNKLLHESRAQTIENFLRQNLPMENLEIVIDAKENWDKLNYQMTYFGREDILTWSRDSIKKYLATRPKDLDWEKLLFEQRTAKATIHYLGERQESEGRSDYGELNLRTAIENKDNDKINRALYYLFENGEQDFSLYEPSIFNYFLNEPSTAGNFAAILSQNYLENIPESCAFLFGWAAKTEMLDNRSKMNFLHLYTLIGRELLKDWDVSSQRLTNVVHPAKIAPFSANVPDQKLLINLHLTFLNFYGQINEGTKIGESFNLINNYLRQVSKTEEEIDRMTLFFNRWSMYTYTMDILSPKYIKEKIDEDGYFILLATAVHYIEKLGEEKYLELHEKCLSINPDRYCQFIYENFQLMRDHNIKMLFCSSCQ